MDFAEVRRRVIVALFSDDELHGQLVLKGGNALSLVHRLSTRTSLDLDFSIDGDFVDLAETRRRMERALERHFGAEGLEVFDLRLEAKPEVRGPHQQAWWGGYELRFKLIEAARQMAVGSSMERRRRSAAVIGPGQQRNFTVDLSKHEHCEGKVEREIDDYTIYVYSLEMIVVEKLRAICQQMEGYKLRAHASARARDFYDIWCVVAVAGVEVGQCGELARGIFAAKQVPLRLLAGIEATREFHRSDWPAVVASVAGPVEEFDYYFDFVVERAKALQALWVE